MRYDLLELPAASYEEVQELIQADQPNRPVAMSVVERRAPGRIFVDKLSEPKSCLILGPLDFAFLVGDLPEGFVALAEQTLWGRARYAPSLCLPDEVAARVSWNRNPRLKLRLDFMFCEPPAPYQDRPDVKRVTPELFMRCPSHRLLSEGYGDTCRAMEKTIGFAALSKTGQVTAEAFATFSGGSQAEIGTSTQPAFRKQGFATAVCSALVATLREARTLPYWSCDADNQGSIALARKIGMHGERRYTTLTFASR